MNIHNWLQFKNSQQVALWRWRWHLQGGTRWWIARDLRDLRTEDERATWRRTENRLRYSPCFQKLRVVNLAHERIERERRRQAIGRTRSAGALVH
jgi:hypothetical protein